MQQLKAPKYINTAQNISTTPQKPITHLQLIRYMHIAECQNTYINFLDTNLWHSFFPQ